MDANHFFFGVYPYIALLVLIVGSSSTWAF